MRSTVLALTGGLACLLASAAPASAGDSFPGVELAIQGADSLRSNLLPISNFQWADPLMVGDTIWFDVVVSNAMGASIQASQITLSVVPQGMGGITFDGNSSEDVDMDASYWIVGNTPGATAIDLGSDNFQFGDNPDNGMPESLSDGDILARFAFTWDGVVDTYDVTIDTSIGNTFVVDEGFASQSPTFTQTSMELFVPEPASLSLLAIGGLAMIRRRRRA